MCFTFICTNTAFHSWKGPIKITESNSMLHAALCKTKPKTKLVKFFQLFVVLFSWRELEI